MYIVLIVVVLLRIKSTFFFIGLSPILSSSFLVYIIIVLYTNRGYTSLISLIISSSWLLNSKDSFLTLVYNGLSDLIAKLDRLDNISISLVDLDKSTILVDLGESTILDII